jgi:hypothetical protein
VLKYFSDGSLKVMLRGRGALLSNLEVAIVDATVIHGTKSFRACVPGDEDRRFRRDGGVGESNELVMRVEQNIFFSAISSFMLTYCCDSFSDVGVDEPKRYVPRGEFVLNTLYFRNVAIGDWAVGRYKKENNGLGAGGGKTANRFAIHVVTVG